MKFFKKNNNKQPNQEKTSKSGVLKIVGLVALGIGSVAAMTATTIAWFNVGTKDSKIKMGKSKTSKFK